MSSPATAIVTGKNKELQQLGILADLCIAAIDQGAKAVDGVELIKRIDNLLPDPPTFTSNDAFDRAKQRATTIANFATTERATGYSHLYGIFAVRLWTILESLVDELVIDALKDSSAVLDHPILSKIKGPLMAFPQVSPDEQAELLVDSIRQATDAVLKAGVGRFEALLEPVGLAGRVHELVRKGMFELANVRNIVVHRNGVADARLVNACPWLRARKGEKLTIGPKMFEHYRLCAYWYLVELRCRVDERASGERDREMMSAQADLLPLLDSFDLLRTNRTAVQQEHQMRLRMPAHNVRRTFCLVTSHKASCRRSAAVPN